MKTKLPIIVLSICLFAYLLICLLFVKTSFAQTAPGSTRVITIVPPSKELALNPGDKTEGILKVVNDSDQPLTFNATVRDYVVNDDHGTPTILPPNTLSNKFSAANWIAVDPNSFTVAPHQRQELNFYVQVPADARPGGHYAAVVYEPTEIIGVNGTGTGVETQIGTLFYIDVSGQINESANVASFKAPGFSEYGPIKITTQIQNNGDLHIKPIGKITVKNMLGQVVASKPLDLHNIFPERSLIYANAFGGKWMIGRYTATLEATYGRDDNLPLVATVAFFVFPWKVGIVALLIIIIIVLAIVALEKKKKRKHTEPATEAPTQTQTPPPTV